MEHLRIPSTIVKMLVSNAENQNLPLLPLLGLILDDFAPDFITLSPQSDPGEHFRRVPELIRGALPRRLTSVDTFRCVYPIFANIYLEIYPQRPLLTPLWTKNVVPTQLFSICLSIVIRFYQILARTSHNSLVFGACSTERLESSSPLVGWLVDCLIDWLVD